MVKNKILMSITLMQVAIFIISAAGIENVDGSINVAAICFMLISLLWLVLFFKANEGRWKHGSSKQDTGLRVMGEQVCADERRFKSVI